MTVSTDAELALNGLRTEIVTSLRTIPDLLVVDDPAKVRLPCCLVGLPRVVRIKTMTSTTTVDVELPVTLMTATPASADAVKWLLEFLLPVMRLIRADEASPAVDAETGETLPAYPLIVRKSLKIQEDGS